jgi:hypothetical protein
MLGSWRRKESPQQGFFAAAQHRRVLDSAPYIRAALKTRFLVRRNIAGWRRPRKIGYSRTGAKPHDTD